MKIKKLVIGIALLGSTFFYTACKEQPQKTEVSPFIGTWVGASYSTTVENVNEQTIKGANGIIQSTTYTFNADSTFTEKVFQYESTGKWKHNVANNTIRLHYTEKAGPVERVEPDYKIVTLNDSMIVWENQLQNYGVEQLTFKRKKQ